MVPSNCPTDGLVVALDWQNDSSARPQTEKNTINPLKFGFFGLKTPGFFRDFLGDHFARVESSGDQNLTMFILHFHVFSHF